MRARTFLLAALACSLALTGSALALDRQAALGDSGEVYFIRTGTYGDLFPAGVATTPTNPVLALDILNPDQSTNRVMVPGTDGPDLESSAIELYEEGTGTLFIVWQAQVSSLYPVLYLTSYKDGTWGPVLKVSNNQFAMKSSPQVAITRDSYDVQDSDGTYSTVHRTVLHMLWWEEGSSDSGNIIYAPILLLDGNYVGAYQTFNLNSFLASQGSSGATGAAAELFRAPRIEAGSNSRTVLIGFADPGTQRLATFEISMLPGELISFSDQLRAHIIESGSKYLPNRDLNGLANDVHDWVLGSGAPLNPAVLSYFAEQSRAHIIESGVKTTSQLKPLADDSRAHIIESGATLVGGRIDNAKAQTAAFSPVIEQIATPEDGSGAPEHMFQLSLDSSRPVPRTGSAPNAIYVSQDGGDAIVSWDTPTDVRYRESTALGWGPINILSLDSSLDLDRAHAILDQRVRDR